MHDKIFLMGCIEMPIVVRDKCIQTIQVFCQTSPAILRPVDPSNYVWNNDWVLLLGLDPVTMTRTLQDYGTSCAVSLSEQL